MKNKILITAALPYANGPLHFGHIAGAYLPGDVYSRFQRLMGNDVLYICGSDEYGSAVAMSARQAGVTPKQHVDHYHQINQDFFKQLNISFDHYSRTTAPLHVGTTQQFFLDLLKNGYIEEQQTLQLYSESENLFLADRYVEGICPKCGFENARGDECTKCAASYEATDLLKPRSKLTGAPLVLKKTNHWFLHFEKLKKPLLEWIETKSSWKKNVLSFARDYIDNLKPRAITRDLEWGVPVPLEEALAKVFYVWFDAPIGYISATKEWNVEKWQEYWCDPATKLVQFVGKDNIAFHAVFFPGMIMGQDQPYKLVDELPANEFYMLEGRQFSKSEGWSIDLKRFFETFSVDQIRYMIAATAPESKDSEFTWSEFQMRCNTELGGKFGNFANRVLTFIQQKCSGILEAPKEFSEQDRAFLASVKQSAAESAKAYESFSLREASHCFMQLATKGNVYFDSCKPWALVKDSTKQQQLAACLYCCIECLKTLALVASPIIPDSAQKLWIMLGFKDSIEKSSFAELLAKELVLNEKLPKPDILFKHVEDEQIAAELAILEKLKVSNEGKKVIRSLESLKALIEFPDFLKVDLRIGKIIEAERVPKSKKILKLKVDLGFEQRTIASGIGEGRESLDSLIGMQVIVVANLKPASIMGITSEGMLVACKNENGLFLPTCDGALPGDIVS